jgi:hypothetical protein
MSSDNVDSVLSAIPLTWSPLIFIVSITELALIVSVARVHASECSMGDSDFPFCFRGADDQENENEEDEVNRESSSSSSSVSDTTGGNDPSSRSTSEASCVSNTFEPEEPEIKREGNNL